MRIWLFIPLALAVACDNEGSFSAASRILDGFSYVDAGAAAVGGSQPFTVPLFSKGAGDVRIFEIVAEDVSVPEGAAEPAFVVDDASWASGCDRDSDGTDDCLDLKKYNKDEDDDTLALPVTFSPSLKGYYEGILTIWSNDNSSTEQAPLPDDETEWTIWRVQLRGLADYACGRVLPDFVDFGHRPVAGDFSASVDVVNCGIVPVTVTSLDVDTTSMVARTLPPLTVLPGQTEEIVVGWTVQDTDPAEGHLTLTSNSEVLTGRTVRFIGNNCPESLDPSGWDKDADGWTSCGGDCDDTLSSTNPFRDEVVGDGRDNDCDGEIDELNDDSLGTDDDGDGCSESGGDCAGLQDCDDNNTAIGPHAEELYNQIDDDCDGVIDEFTDGHDDDGDGWLELNGDCDDTEALVSPDGVELVDGRDNDCDGITDEGGPGYDDDGDGFTDVETEDPALSDCDDQDPWVFVGAREYCDGYDNDCDGLVDDGEADEVNGACTFVPARKTTAADSTDTGAAESSGGCNSAMGLNVSWFSLLAASALVRRRSRD